MPRDYIVKTLNRYTHPSYQPMRYSQEHGKHVPMQDENPRASNTAHFYSKKEAKEFVNNHRKKYGEGHNMDHHGEGKKYGDK